MKLVRYNPLKDLEEMSEKLNSLFGRPSLQLAETDQELLSTPEWAPSVDISETDNDYLMTVEVPGVKKEDLKIDIEDGVLCIEGERKQEKEEKGKKYHRIERFYGNFVRRFTLPSNVEEKQIKADYKDGVLNITIPKTKKSKPKAFNVKINQKAA